MALGLRPFWRYFGGKWRLAPRYPAPTRDTIVEPFAGAAGYALRYPERRVILVERYAVVAGIWRYLISVSEAELRRIPLVEAVDDLPSWVPREARDLVGFNLNTGASTPRPRLAAGCRRYRDRGSIHGWGERMRERVASQLRSIRHWQIREGDYTIAPDVDATWFVDSPYQQAGTRYVHGPREIDFAMLATWCLAREGQTIVCEGPGATWLPFRDLAVASSGMRRTGAIDRVWTNTNA